MGNDYKAEIASDTEFKKTVLICLEKLLENQKSMREQLNDLKYPAIEKYTGQSEGPTTSLDCKKCHLRDSPLECQKPFPCSVIATNGETAKSL